MNFAFTHPILLCFCGPSGSGKSTLCKSIVDEDSGLSLSISTTTRAPRENEIDGEHYFFVSEDEFEKRVRADKFIEHAQFNSKRYGTEKTNIERAKSSGKHLLFDIEVEGVKQLKQLYPGNVVTVFVFPSSMDILRARLIGRGTNSPEDVAQRLAIAEREIEVLRSSNFSDYIVVNDILERAQIDARAIIRAELLRISRIASSSFANLLK